MTNSDKWRLYSEVKNYLVGQGITGGGTGAVLRAAAPGAGALSVAYGTLD